MRYLQTERFYERFTLLQIMNCFAYFRGNVKESILSGRSVVWLARLLWEQEAVSSNLTVPTILPLRAVQTLILPLTDETIRGCRH